MSELPNRPIDTLWHKGERYSDPEARELLTAAQGGTLSAPQKRSVRGLLSRHGYSSPRDPQRLAKAATEALVANYQGLVTANVRRFTRHKGWRYLEDDLWGTAQAALGDCIARMDPGSAVPLATQIWRTISTDIERFFASQALQMSVPASQLSRYRRGLLTGEARDRVAALDSVKPVYLDDESRAVDPMNPEPVAGLHEVIGDPDTHVEEDALAGLIQAENAAELSAAMELLSDEERSVIILTFWEGMEQVEQAELLGVTERTVRRWKDSGLEKLRKGLRGHE